MPKTANFIPSIDRELKAIPKEYVAKAKVIMRSILNDEHYTIIAKNALVKNGIRKLNYTQKKRFKRIFRKNSKKFSNAIFIPASGSGSRLFKDLIAMERNFNPNEETFSAFVNRTEMYGLHTFFQHIKSLPFYNHFKVQIADINLTTATSDEKKIAIVKLFLNDRDLPLKELPKALIPIHCDKYSTITAFQEQIDLYNKTKNNYSSAQITFTIASDHTTKFASALSEIWDDHISENLGINLVVQDEKSKVHAIDSDSNLVLTQVGIPLLKPSGHGALLSNLNTIEEDIIQLRNIDNISCSKHHNKYIEVNKLLTGYLIYSTRQVHKYLELLEKDAIEGKKKKQLIKFLRRYFHIDLQEVLDSSLEGFHITVYKLLNAPIRICGMIPTIGNTGGAPYWVLNDIGIPRLQIVEKLEIDPLNNIQKDLASRATHFNPVNMVMYSKDYNGVNFDLTEFASSRPNMVVEKSYKGQPIKFIEQTGLWNGGMRDYLTMFIEIKEDTFNPIKEIVDVYKTKHQS